MRQRRFEHITGINGSFGCPGANYSMNLVNKQYDLTLCLADFIHHCLQSLLKLTTEFAPGHQGSHIQSHYLAPFKGIRNIISGDFLG